MIEVKKSGIVLEKTGQGFENDSVLNPGVVDDGETVHMLYRAVRTGNYSSFGYCNFIQPETVHSRLPHPLIIPEHDYEKHGIEDPRIVKIEGTFYITYTAYDGHNALGALATSKDMKTFVKHGIIAPMLTYTEFDFCIECCKGLSEKYLRFYKLFKERAGEESADKLLVWDKDLVFFPRKINGKFAFLHRIYPSIQLVYFNNPAELNEPFWRNYLFHLNEHIVIDSRYPFEASYIGGGCPPIETEDGWLLIYHGVEDTQVGYVYHAAAALLDLNDPTKEIARLKYPLFSPTEIWEKEGVVRNVVFPTGAVVRGDTLFVYYGAADTRVAVATMKLSELLSELKKSKD